jgi:hypothetical protein
MGTSHKTDLEKLVIRLLFDPDLLKHTFQVPDLPSRNGWREEFIIRDSFGVVGVKSNTF